MYFVKYGKEYLHDPRIDEYKLIDLSLTGGENSCGYCDFTIYSDHPLYGKLKERDNDNPIQVYDDDILIFSGFIYELGKEFYLDGHVKCKGDLDYLKDSIVRPYSTSTRGFGNKAPASIREYFNWLINQHNGQIEASKQFKVGINQGSNLETLDYLYRQSDKYPTTFDEINEKLLDSFGGYLRLRYENEVRYIDYLADWTDVNTQILDFGVNLTDYSQTDDSEQLATYVIPIGAKMSATLYEYNDGYFLTSDTKVDTSKEYFTLKYEYSYCTGLTSFIQNVKYYEYDSTKKTYSLTPDTTPDSSKTYYVRSSKYSSCYNLTAFAKGVRYYEYNSDNDESDLPLSLDGMVDGPVGTGYLKAGDMILHQDSVNRYGRIGFRYEDSELTTREQLVRYGVVALNEYISPKRTIEIKAVDMHLVNKDISPIRIGEYIRVRSKPHNLDSYFLCRNIELDLSNPENSVYTLGIAYDTLTGQQNERIKKLNSTINNQYEATTKLSEEAKATAKSATDRVGEAVAKAEESLIQVQPIINAYESGELNGEDAILLRIESSRGTVFKNDNISTILRAVIYYGGSRISNIDDLHDFFGPEAYLEWQWQKKDENEYGVILATDEMIGEEGFTLTVSSEKVDTKATFMCNLII